MTFSHRFLSVGVVFAVAIAYRLATFSGLSNDHYMHLAWAQEILRGGWPGRDFVEPGMPMTTALSALAQVVGGQGIVAEFVLCLVMIAAAAGLTCWLAASFTGSLALGVYAAGLQIAIFPRFYNYPKLIVPLVGLALLWRYLERPTMRRTVLVGAWVATAFLFRHDYLLYLGLAACVAFLLQTTVLGRRAVAAHAAVCAITALVIVLPYLVALEHLGGVGAHIRDSVEFASGEGNQWVATPPWFSVARPEPVPDRTALAPAGFLRRAARAVVLDVALPLAPVVNAQNAGVALYYAAFALPLALLFALRRSFSRRAIRDPVTEDKKTVVLVVLALVLAVAIVRHPIDARLPDAGGLMPLVLVAAAAGLARRGGWWRSAARIGLGVAALAVALHGAVWGQLYQAGIFAGPAAVATRSATIWSTLRGQPWDDLWPNGRLPKSIRYLRACTTAQDRVLVTWFAPEVYVFSGRGFAAGHSYFIRRAFYSPDYQRQMIEQLERERVPIVLFNLDPDQRWFRARFHLLQEYLDREYVTVGRDRFRYDTIAIAARRSLTPTGVYADEGWPCFR